MIRLECRFLSFGHSDSMWGPVQDGVGSTWHLDVRAWWWQPEHEQQNLKVHKVAGDRNPADSGAKSHTIPRFELLRELCGIVDCSAVDRRASAGVHTVES